MKKQSNKKFHNYKIVKWVMFCIFILYAVSLLIPFIWMLINCFKSTGEFNAGNVFGFPSDWTFSNLIEALNTRYAGQTVWSMLLMSILTTVLGTLINVACTVAAAYCVAKFNFPGKRLILGVAIFTMIVPIVGTLPAQVNMMETFYIDDSLIGVLFLYSGCFSFNFILLHSSFQNISWNYAEAAQIDGAGRGQVFFKVMLPLAKGPIISVSILQAIAIWNDYTTPALYMRSHLTLAAGLHELQVQYSSNYPILFSTTMLMVIPIFILFAIFQKTIIKNTVAGGLKG